MPRSPKNGSVNFFDPKTYYTSIVVQFKTLKNDHRTQATNMRNFTIPPLVLNSPKNVYYFYKYTLNNGNNLKIIIIFGRVKWLNKNLGDGSK